MRLIVLVQSPVGHPPHHHASFSGSPLSLGPPCCDLPGEFTPLALPFPSPYSLHSLRFGSVFRAAPEPYSLSPSLALRSAIRYPASGAPHHLTQLFCNTHPPLFHPSYPTLPAFSPPLNRTASLTCFFSTWEPSGHPFLEHPPLLSPISASSSSSAISLPTRALSPSSLLTQESASTFPFLTEVLPCESLEQLALPTTEPLVELPRRPIPSYAISEETEFEINELLRECFKPSVPFALPQTPALLNPFLPNPQWLSHLFSHLNEEFTRACPGSEAIRSCMVCPMMRDLLSPIAKILEDGSHFTHNEATPLAPFERKKLATTFLMTVPSPVSAHTLSSLLHFNKRLFEIQSNFQLCLADSLEVLSYSFSQSVPFFTDIIGSPNPEMTFHYRHAYECLQLFVYNLAKAHRAQKRALQTPEIIYFRDTQDVWAYKRDYSFNL